MIRLPHAYDFSALTVNAGCYAPYTLAYPPTTAPKGCTFHLAYFAEYAVKITIISSSIFVDMTSIGHEIVSTLEGKLSQIVALEDSVKLRNAVDPMWEVYPRIRVFD